MKHYLSILLLLFITSLFGQNEYECAANPGDNKIICFSDAMSLSAPVNLLYNTPPNIQWTYLPGGPVPVNDVHIASPNSLNSAVTRVSGLPWAPGNYNFQFCVDCKDSNGDNIINRPCAVVTITVKPDVTVPVITELDGLQDGSILVCDEVTFNTNSLSLASGESYTITPIPNDGYLTKTDIGGVVTFLANDFFSQCEYEIVYNISNGGCGRSTSVKVKFVNPKDPNYDGIIEGTIDKCPACSTTVTLIGDRPGCGGIGIWTLGIHPQGASAVFTPGSLPGTTSATVSAAGHYSFIYTVTNIGPCPDSQFEIECDILEVGNFSLGPDQFSFYCGNILPAGIYPYCFNQLDNALYKWESSNPAITISPNFGNCTNLIATNDVPLPITIYVTATKYFIDPDCDGPLLPQVLILPYTDPVQNQVYVNGILNTPGICYYICKDEARVYFFGAPVVNVETEDIYFLCSTGSETVKLSNYFAVTNGVGHIANVTVLTKPECSNLPTYFPAYQLQELNVVGCGGCGVFEFKIDVITQVNGIVSPCTTTVYLTIYIETSKPVNAGTDQVKCPGEDIRLNATNPYCSAFGTWTQINCTNLDYYIVTIKDIQDPNTEITVGVPIDSICPPDTLCFVWSFISEGGDCDLSDTTRVIIKDSCCYNQPAPCPGNLHVASNCVEGHVTLTLLSNLGIVNPNEYTIIWSPGGQGNPVNLLLPPNGIVYYNVQVFKVIGNDTVCYQQLSGSVSCPIEGCGAHVVESCGPNGNIILTLVNAQGNIILPSTYDEIFWSVYANGNSSYSVNLQNPITIQQDACYSVRYQHIIPPHILECVFNFPKTCPTITCPGPCENFNDFFVAGCGDNLDISLNLTFPPGCQSFCGSQGTSGMLGVFHTSNNQPVNPALFNITWGSTNFHGTYATGNLNQILPVTIVTTAPNCFWKSGYVPQCCSTPTPYIECQQPIVKYCRPDGSFYYIVGAPQIFWTPVPGAMSYTVEVITGGIEGCCSGTSVVLPPQTAYTNTWQILPGMGCFSIRVKANILGCPSIPGPAWSNTYVYCPQEVVCNPVITVCGCCSGNYRSEEMSGLPTTIVSEEEVLAIIKANPGSEYVTLRDALNAAGTNVKAELEFNVFPNPASDQIVVKAGNTVKGTFKVQVTDLLQREWRNEAFDAAGEKTLNISDLPNGIYLVTIRNARGDQMMTEKIVVMK